MLSCCDARQDSRNGREATKVENVTGVSLPSNNGQLPSYTTTQEVQNPETVTEGLNHTQPKEKAGTDVTNLHQKGHHTPNSSCQVRNGNGHAETQGNGSSNEQSANVTALAKGSNGKAEGTTGTQDKPTYFAQASSKWFWFCWGIIILQRF